VTDVPGLVPLPAQPDGVPWPAGGRADDVTGGWPVGGPPASATAALAAALDEAFAPAGPLGPTYAVVVVHRGRLVAERYAGRLPHRGGPPEPVGPATRLRSWSMAKSVLHSVAGLAVADGLVELDTPAPVPAWADPADPRHAITLEQLLAMRDGLDFAEVYEDVPGSDVVTMLYGAGRADMAAYAASRPPAAPPGTRFSYSSGTSNIISGIVARAVGPGEPYRRYLADRLFGPTGMTSAVPGFDGSGTWVASSSVHATARDFARFGLLALRDGVWNGFRILPEGWVDHGRRPRSVEEPSGHGFGAHWWVDGDAAGTFRASGHEGQSITVSPGADLVVVRLGRSPEEAGPALDGWRARTVGAFA